jgi:aminopeptidase C
MSPSPSVGLVVGDTTPTPRCSPLRGVIVGETQQSVRFRIDDSWDIDIYKSMILAVEEDSWMDSIT